MIKIYSRWEDDDWFLKSRLEPWVCYATKEEEVAATIASTTSTPTVATPTATPTAATPTAAPDPSVDVTTPTSMPTPTPAPTPTPSTYTAPKAEDWGEADEVAYAQDLVSGAPALGDPTAIPAPVQRKVTPEEIVEFRVAQALKKDSPFTAQAIANAKQAANKSGMLNTSIAASAGIDAAIKNILPMAQQDAATIHGQGLENQRAVNEFLMQDYLMRNQFRITEYTNRMTTYNQGLDQAFKANQQAILNAWQEEQNELNRELDRWKTEFSAESSAALQGSAQGFAASQSAKACEQNAISRRNAYLYEINASNRSEAEKQAAIKNVVAAYQSELRSCR